jgi:hypothetical protein
MNEKELQEKETLAKDLIPHVQMSEAGDWIDHGIEEVIRLVPTLIAEVRRGFIEIYVVYYQGEVKLVTTNTHDVAENWFNNSRDKIQIWKNGKLIEERS